MTALPGLTNIVHWSDGREGPTVTRQGRPFASRLGIDRHREAEILRGIQHLDIGPEILSMDAALDRTVFRAIPGMSLDHRMIPFQLQSKSLKILSRLHLQPANGQPFSPSRMIGFYLAEAPIAGAFRQFCERQAELAHVLETSANPVLCHNDCVAKNWILLPNGELKLIDFEFAAPNDPAFDLATWCLDFGAAPENRVLAAYSGWDAALARRVEAYLPIVDALWTLYCACLSKRSPERIRQEANMQMHKRLNRLAPHVTSCLRSSALLQIPNMSLTKLT